MRAAGICAGALVVMALAPAAATALPPSLGEFSQINSVAQSGNGKIVAGGVTKDCAPSFSRCQTPSGAPLLGRYTSSGKLDPSFGDDGGLIVDGPPPSDDETDAVSDLGVQPDGKVVVEIVRNPDLGSGHATALQRFDPDGARDMGFGTDGEVELPTGVASRFVLDPDGKIVVLANTESAQTSQRSVTLERYTADGEPDPSFGIGGASEYLQSTDGDSIYAIDLLRDSEGRYVILTEESSGFYEDTLDVLRIDSSGALDTSFGGGDGYAQAVGPGSEILYSGGFAVAPDDGILVGENNDSVDFHSCTGRGIVRLDPDGSIDSSFGAHGGPSLGDLFPCSRLRALSSSGDGSVFSLGTHYGFADFGQITLVRSTSEGSLDTAFGSGGGVRVPATSIQSTPTDVIAEPDGGALVAGTLGSGQRRCVGGNPKVIGFSCSALLLARYDKNGEPDPSFGHRGLSVVPRFSICRLREARGRLILPERGHRVSIRMNYRSYRSSKVFVTLRRGPGEQTTLFKFTTQKSAEPVALIRNRSLGASELSGLRSHPEDQQIAFKSVNDAQSCRSRQDLVGRGSKPYDVLRFK